MENDSLHAIRWLEERIGQEVFITEWLSISQEETDQFSKLTDDEDPMHNDPDWAKTTHWGGTIVQAAHVLALGAGKVAGADIPLKTESDGRNYVLNYGYDRVRVISPLRVGRKFRYRGVVVDVRQKSESEYVLTFRVTVEVDAQQKPFMVFESLIFWATDQQMTPYVAAENHTFK